jgi:hypothetical protein
MCSRTRCLVAGVSICFQTDSHCWNEESLLANVLTLSRNSQPMATDQYVACFHSVHIKNHYQPCPPFSEIQRAAPALGRPVGVDRLTLACEATEVLAQLAHFAHDFVQLNAGWGTCPGLTWFDALRRVQVDHL